MFAIAIRGGGPYSVDRLIGKRTVEPYRWKLWRKYRLTRFRRLPSAEFVFGL